MLPPLCPTLPEFRRQPAILPDTAPFGLHGVRHAVTINRLERGTFSWPARIEPEAVKLKLTPEALALLTDGIDLRGATLRPWYQRE